MPAGRRDRRAPGAPADHRYLMLYASAGAIGAAFSADGATFTRVDAADSPHGQAGLVLSSVACTDALRCRWEMWLVRDAAGATDAQPVVLDNMAGVWHATSFDGVTWSISYTGARDLAWMASAPGEHLGLRGGADVAGEGTARYLVYVGFDDANVPSGATLPDRSMQGSEPGVMALDLAARDAPN